jgi:hypothetical protein
VKYWLNEKTIPTYENWSNIGFGIVSGHGIVVENGGGILVGFIKGSLE